ncbi:MAG: dTDP-4-dehydrorhamnose reductase [Candidatus Rokubacteria bacterium]|nr:dTDP-4-dehydrorhamnose reductase [Candidatus Rokubacteria bacterium]
MKVFVTGAAGMLGAALCPELVGRGYKVIATGRQSGGGVDVCLDVRDLHAVMAVTREIAPDLVVHLAAETDVDRCELHPDDAFRTNALGTENVALACRKVGAALIYLSTAWVFDGLKLEPYCEFDVPNPINVYGRSKLEGEEALRRLLGEHFIIRASWMVGGVERDKKFVAKIARLILRQDEVLVVNDKWGSLTFTFDLAQAICDVVGTGRYGLYHAVNHGYCTRYEVARAIAEELGRAEVVRITPVSSAHFPLPAPRPRSEMLRNYRLELLGLDQMPPWQTSLKRYLQLARRAWQDAE